MKLAIGSDHAGFELKEQVREYLESKGHKVKDFGAYSTDRVDYPNIGHAVAKYAVDEDVLGIVICGTGIGISIAANKVKGARAALCHDVNYAKLAREHNNANVLAMGGRFTPMNNAVAIVDAFLTTEFEGGRHQTRIDLLEVE